MSSKRKSRRVFLEESAAALAAGSVPYWFTLSRARASGFRSPADRPVVGCIGTGDRWKAIGPQAMNFGDVAAVCDVDAEHAAQARETVDKAQQKSGRSREVAVCEDYRRVLDRPDIDVVTIVTPDHWHAKIAIEAIQAGKDVYCEKPLTLTIDEGKQIARVLEHSKQVFQVGTQQRSEMDLRFLKAVALVRAGRIGKVQRVQCAIGGAPQGGPFDVTEPPPHLNWDMWLGQAPRTGYIDKRCHYEFRWWYEYSGGKMTDWGAHHIDIAQWAIGMDRSGPVSVEGTAEHPCPFENGYPTVDNVYNAATAFHVTCKFAHGVELVIRHDTENGILFQGSDGELFVSRGTLSGEAVDALADRPLSEDALTALYKGKKPGNHMANFFECVQSREQPISDVYTHHRAMTTCHLANIAIRLGRPIRWNPETEQIVDDPEAQRWQAREQREGYEIRA